MRVVGYIAGLVVAGGVLAGIAVGIRSIPDMRRYARMRKM
jgi:hypothetical protein